MKKKAVMISFLAVLMLVTISFATAVRTNAERKESPLYVLRTSRAIGGKLSNLIENIKTSFLGERMSFMPFSFLFRDDDPSPGGPVYTKLNCVCGYTNMYSYYTCTPTCSFGQMSTVCGGACTYENCHTADSDTCRFFCLPK